MSEHLIKNIANNPSKLQNNTNLPSSFDASALETHLNDLVFDYSELNTDLQKSTLKKKE